MPPADQLVWEERGNKLNKAILYLMNLKNEHAKKDLCLAYSQGNLTAYPPTIEGMTRYLSTQYPNNKPANQRRGKREVKRKVMTQNLKTRIVIGMALLVYTLKILRQLKNRLFLVELLVSALKFQKQM